MAAVNRGALTIHSIVGSGSNWEAIRVEDPDTYDPDKVDPKEPRVNAIVTIREHYHYELVYTGVVTTSFQQRQPQNSYDPRVDFRDYALQLSTNGDPNDCRKLALLAYKAGQVFGANAISGLMNGLTEVADVTQSGSDPNYRVGVLRRDPYFGNGFGTGGFLPQFQDHAPGSQNQVRHFVGWFAAGAFVTPPVARRQLWDQEGTRHWINPDVALGQQAINMGHEFGKTNDWRGLAEGIWRDVCGGKGKLIP